MTDKELRVLDEMLTNLEIWSTWNKTFANEMIGICSKMRNLLADRKTEPQTETQNSNLTFEKVMEEIQTQVIEFPDTHQRFIFTRKIEMDGDSIKICGWEYEGVKAGEREGE